MGRFCRFLYTFVFVVLIALIINAAVSAFYGAAVTNVSTGVKVSSPSGGSHVYDVIKEEDAYKKRVYLGGGQVGFELDICGVMIAEFTDVDTVCGAAKLKSELAIGDVIVDVDGVAVRSAQDIVDVLNSNKNKTDFNAGIVRNGERKTVTVNPLIDRVSGEYRLGISVQSEIGGIGTVTFVKRDGRFAALGHAVGAGAPTCISGGKVYECKIIGIERGARGKAGSIKGTLNKKAELGSVDKNCNYGLYGCFDNFTGFAYDVGSRNEVVCGRAQIYSEISGVPSFYDVEILKTAYQSASGEKGLVLRVTDKRLISLTGGIVQGMSGSPIIQNNKIVGAVTHVFVNDPLRGYGIYVDWMLDN